MEHEAQTGLLVEQVGIVKTDDNVFGASADGFIGEDGGAEYKCFLSPEKLRSIYLDSDISDIIDQVQGCMWIKHAKQQKEWLLKNEWSFSVKRNGRPIVHRLILRMKLGVPIENIQIDKEKEFQIDLTKVG